MENEKWIVKKSDAYIRYTIPEKEWFSTIEYKVLSSQKETNLLQCSKVTCNGQLQLIYNVQQLQIISGVLPGLSTETYYLLLAQIIEIYRKVKNNGFLKGNHLDLTIDRMYIRLEPIRISMIYLPVQTKEDKKELVDGEIFNFIRSTTTYYNDEMDEGIQELVRDLDSNTLSLEELLIRLTNGYYESISVEYRNREIERQKKLLNQATMPNKMKLALKNTIKEFSIPITKREFVIGKKESVVDGVIAGHPTVSRVHCKIVCTEDTYAIVDLGSANGTLVNGITCSPNVPMKIQKGDQITISDLVFYFMEDK
ncbi:FHA domain-containing protein [Anaerosporobacter faecicola]|uniref:FHA domain-containing protein n=1 Tax=Anaerosporobacter faecicola TaxID=2718714 RepID=UPI001439DFA0|nr:FHA domain-containing protein [Anaerosporobacter faecicola]